MYRRWKQENFGSSTSQQTSRNGSGTSDTGSDVSMTTPSPVSKDAEDAAKKLMAEHDQGQARLQLQMEIQKSKQQQRVAEMKRKKRRQLAVQSKEHERKEIAEQIARDKALSKEEELTEIAERIARDKARDEEDKKQLNALRKTKQLTMTLTERIEKAAKAATEKQVMQGNLGVDVAGHQENIVRIFTSSTFKDTVIERNALLDHVYPRLKQFCHENGSYEFEVVDMRWGVRDKASDDHKTWELCQKELHLCQQLSSGPCFVTFLSCRYGNRFLPSTIPESEYVGMVTAMDDDERALAEKWYNLDENANPPIYMLRRISRHLPNFLSDDIKLRKDAQNQWWNESDQLRKILKKMAKLTIKDPERVHLYERSVTESEIAAGILDAENQAQNCLWFRRKLTGLEQDDMSKMACSYSDNEVNKEDRAEARSLLEDLCERRIKSVLPGNNIVEYDVQWDEKGVTLARPDHQKYIEKFSKDFEEKLKVKILEGMQRRESAIVSKERLYIELVQHITFCNHRIKRFAGKGREGILEGIDEYLNSQSNLPLVIHGSSGSGKTTLVAMAVKSVWNMYFKDRTPAEQKAVVVFRFLGTTPDSSTLVSMVKSVCKQIQRNFPGSGLDKLRDTNTVLLEHLKLATAETPIFLLLDSLDQLSAANNSHLLKWLPKTLPPHVKVVVSTLPEEEYRCFQVLQASISERSQFIHVPLVELPNAENILQIGLKRSKRKLTDKQMQLVLQTFSAAGELSPLHIKMFLNEVRRWHSFTPLDECRLYATVQEAIKALYEKLETRHGELFVKRALGYITASKRGLTSAELEDILSCDEDVLDDVYEYWTPPVRRLPPLLWVRLLNSLPQGYLTKHAADGRHVYTWFHRQLKEVATSHFLSDEATCRILHLNMADFFLGKWASVEKPYTNAEGQKRSVLRHVTPQPLEFHEGTYNLRKFSELPYHLIKSQQLEVLKSEVGCNFRWLFTKLKAKGLRRLQMDIIDSVEAFPEDKDIAIIADILHLSQDALKEDPHQLPVQIIARLDSSWTEGHIGKLLRDAKLHKSEIAVLKPTSQFLTPPGGALRHSMATNAGGHDVNKRTESGIAVHGIQISANGKNAVLGFLKCIELWDIRYGYLLHHIDTSHDCNTELAQVGLYMEKRILASSKDVLIAYDYSTAQLVSKVTVESTHSCPCVFHPIVLGDEDCIAVYNGEVLNIYKMPDMRLLVSCKDNQLHCSAPKEFATPVIRCHQQTVVCSMEDKQVLVVDVTNLSNISVDKIAVFENSEAGISSVFIIPENKILVAGNSSAEMEVYDIQTKKMVSKLSVDLNHLYSELSVSDNGSHVLVMDDDYLKVWDIETQKEIASIEHEKTVTLASSIDGRNIVTVQSNFKLLVWDLAFLESHDPSANDMPENVLSMAPCGTSSETLLVCTGIEVNGAPKVQIRVWSADNLQCLTEMVVPWTSCVLPIKNHLWTIAVMLGETGLQGINLEHKQVLPAMCDNVDSVWDPLITVDGAHCVVVVRDGGTTLAVINLMNGSVVRETRTQGDLRIRHVEVSNDGSTAVFTHYKFVGLTVWDIKNNTTKTIQEQEKYDVSLFTACLTNNGRYLAMVTEQLIVSVKGQPNTTLPGIIVWDLEKETIIQKWHPENYRLLNIDLFFTNDDKLIITNRTLSEMERENLVYTHMWDVTKGTQLIAKDNHTAITISDDGQHALLFCPKTGLASLWNMKVDRCLGAIFVDKIDDIVNSKIVCYLGIRVLLFKNGHLVSTLELGKV